MKKHFLRLIHKIATKRMTYYTKKTAKWRMIDNHV